MLTKHGCKVRRQELSLGRQANRPVAARTASDAVVIDALLASVGTPEGLLWAAEDDRPQSRSRSWRSPKPGKPAVKCGEGIGRPHPRQLCDLLDADILRTSHGAVEGDPQSPRSWSTSVAGLAETQPP